MEGVDGEGQFLCADPIDCVQKCAYLSQNSVGGMGTPAACSLCDQPCPSNIVSTITSLVDAIFADVLTIARVIGVCFGEHGGIGACVCSLVETLQPQWRRVSRNPVTRCENGDPFGLLLDGITDAAAGVAESSVNNLVDAGNRILNNILGFVGYNNEIPRLCIPTNADPRRCNGGRSRRAKPTSCSSASTRLVAWKRCARGRSATICTSDGMLDQWNDLFFTGDQISGLEQEFVAAFGASFDETDPALVSLLAQVERGAPAVNLEARKAICDSAAFASSMTLDMIITSCAFAAFGQHCPASVEVSRQFEFLIDSTTFELPNVRFNYEVSPPPPPPVLLGATAALSLLDEEGFEKARSTVDSLLPTLQHTASSSVGGAVGEFLADEVVSQEQLTRAYLSSIMYEKDSLAQRWVVAEHTGVWRKACASIVTLLLNNEELHSDQDGLEYDRNMLAYVTAEAALGLNMNDVSVLDMWKLLCSHGGYRVPTYRSNYETYGYPAGTQVHNFLPIVGYGSLTRCARSAWPSKTCAAPPLTAIWFRVLLVAAWRACPGRAFSKASKRSGPTFRPRRCTSATVTSFKRFRWRMRSPRRASCRPS